MFLGSELAAHRAKLRTSTVQEALSLQPQGIVDRTASAYPELTCLSFNLRKESDHLEARMAALLVLVECIDPDFICLQENTARHEALLSTSAFIQERYGSLERWASSVGRTLGVPGVVVVGGGSMCIISCPCIVSNAAFPHESTKFRVHSVTYMHLFRSLVTISQFDVL